MRIVRLLALTLVLLPTLAFAQTADPAAVDRLVAQTLEAWHVPGISVAIVKDDKVVFIKGYGVKDLGTKERVTADTLFHIGSTTKAFTTTAMAMLVDEKKLGWDDPVRQHLEYFHLSDPCADSMVTMRDLVTHRTGLGRHDVLWDNTPLSREQVIRAMGSVKLNKPFRTTYQYQNIMFVAAGEAVAATAKTSWNDFVRTRILEPLGMTETKTTIADWNASPDHATGYRWDAKSGRAVAQGLEDDDNLAPAGAIKSSAHDMARWLRFQLADGVIDGKRLVSSEALGETKTPQIPLRMDGSTRETHPETNLLAYAMAWNVEDYRGTLLVSHGGALNGFRAQVALLPKEHAGVVVLQNIGRGYAGIAVRNAILDLLIGHGTRDWNSYLLQLDQHADAEGEARLRARDAARKPDTHPSRELAAYVGTYTNPAYGNATITLENDALTLHWMRMNLPLEHFHYDTFHIHSDPDDVDELTEFHLGTDGTVNAITLFGEELTKK